MIFDATLPSANFHAIFPLTLHTTIVLGMKKGYNQHMQHFI